jgi:hypothetical protein
MRRRGRREIQLDGHELDLPSIPSEKAEETFEVTECGFPGSLLLDWDRNLDVASPASGPPKGAVREKHCNSDANKIAVRCVRPEVVERDAQVCLETGD